MSRSTLFSILCGFAMASTVLGHAQMSYPFPLHSTFNPKTPEALKDYSMASPLIADGTYPCKGFIMSPSDSSMATVASYAAGSSVSATISGTATHNGGSCQFSMSYDNGVTWSVIHSIIGGCLVDGMTMEVPIPKEAPSGKALFSWSWFNRSGNREMYQNCASVEVTGGGTGLTGPAPFVASADVNDCVTIENIDVVFPNPGSSVKYGGSYASSRPTTPAGFTGSNCVGPGETSGGSSPAPVSSGTDSASSSLSVAPASSSWSEPPSSAASVASSSAPSVAPAGPSSTLVSSHLNVNGTVKTCKKRKRAAVDKRTHAQQHATHERLVRRRRMH